MDNVDRGGQRCPKATRRQDAGTRHPGTCGQGTAQNASTGHIAALDAFHPYLPTGYLEMACPGCLGYHLEASRYWNGKTDRLELYCLDCYWELKDLDPGEDIRGQIART